MKSIFASLANVGPTDNTYSSADWALIVELLERVRTSFMRQNREEEAGLTFTKYHIIFGFT